MLALLTPEPKGSYFLSNEPENLLVALGTQLKHCPSVLTLGLRPSILDFSSRERELILKSRIVFFPTLRYIDLFQTIEKKTYPSASSYYIGGNLLKQAIFFKLLGIPHPETLICMAREGVGKVLNRFDYPFWGVRYRSRSRSRAYVLITRFQELDTYRREYKLTVYKKFFSTGPIARAIIMDSQITCYYETDIAQNGNEHVIKKREIPRDVLNSMKLLLTASRIDHGVATFRFDGERYLLWDLHYVLPIKELKILRFDLYQWLCKRIKEGKFKEI